MFSVLNESVINNRLLGVMLRAGIVCSEIGTSGGSLRNELLLQNKNNNLFARRGISSCEKGIFEEQLKESQKPIGLLPKLRLQTS